MDTSAALRRIIHRLPDIYRSGDIRRYLDHYSPNITVCASGSVMNYSEVCSFILSLFENGGTSLEFEIGELDNIQFSEGGDAAVIYYPWRERFRYADGHETDVEYHATDVWCLRSGEWRIEHVHLTTIKEHPI